MTDLLGYLTKAEREARDNMNNARRTHSAVSKALLLAQAPVPPPEPVPDPGTPPEPPRIPVTADFAIDPVPVGGGGFIVDRDIHAATGNQYIGTDVQNGYIMRPGDAEWTPIFRPDTLPDDGVNHTRNPGAMTDGFGCFMGKWAPSNGERLVTQVNGLFYTIDLKPGVPLREKGAFAATRWNLPPRHLNTNSGFDRWWGPSIAGHPDDDAVWIVGTNNDGCYLTVTAGQKVEQLDLPPCKGLGAMAFGSLPRMLGRERYLVWIDQGDANYCYVFVQGVGLHRSRSGPRGPYVLVPGGPIGATCLAGEDDGTLWMTGDPRITDLINYGFLGTKGWEAGNGALLEARSGVLHVTNGPDGAGYASQAYAVKAGLLYRFTVLLGTTVQAGVSGGSLLVGTAPGRNDIGVRSGQPGRMLQFEYTPEADQTVYLSLEVTSAVAGDFAKFYGVAAATIGIYRIDRGANRFESLGNGMTPGIEPWHIAIDPFDRNRVLIAKDQPAGWSEDRGKSFKTITGQANITLTGEGSEVKWRRSLAPKIAGGMKFDPHTEFKVHWNEGFGSAISPDYRGQIHLADNSRGIEEVIHNLVRFHPVTETCLITGQDLPVMRVDNWTEPVNIPSRGPVGAGMVQIGDGIDYAIDDPNHWVCSVGTVQDNHCYNDDNGDHDKWHRFAGTWPTRGGHGAIACGNRGNFLLAQSTANALILSKDLGDTLERVTLNGSTEFLTIPFYYLHGRRMVAACKDVPGKFAAVISTRRANADVYDNPLGGLWLFEDEGDRRTQVQRGVVGFHDVPWQDVQRMGQDFRQFYACQIEFVPGYPDEMLYTPHADFTRDPLFWLKKDGTQSAEVSPRVRNVFGFAFGANLPGAARPAVYFVGDVDGVRGAWVTLDWFVTFVLISASIGGSDREKLVSLGQRMGTGFNHGVGASMQTFGRAVFGISGCSSLVTSLPGWATAT